MTAVSAWVKLALDIAWAWVSLSVVRSIYKPPGSYWVYVNRTMQVTCPSTELAATTATYSSPAGAAFTLQALFSAGMIILVEKVFLNFVSINFHRKALAERLAENKIGLAALDRLSNVQPTSNKSSWKKKGHRQSSSADILQKGHKNGQGSGNSSGSMTPENNGKKGGLNFRRGKKRVTSVIIDHVGEAIGQVALKDSRFHRNVEYGSLDSARKLAKKLFMSLSDVHPPRDYLIVEGEPPFASILKTPLSDLTSRLRAVLPNNCGCCETTSSAL